MKKFTLALFAAAAIFCVGTSVASDISSPGDYYPTLTSTTPIPGVKGDDWDCAPSEEDVCAYLELENHSRIPVEGIYFDN